MLILCNNVRDEIVLDHDDLITQQQFALLKAGDLQLIARARAGQGIDCCIKVAVFKAQCGKPLAHFLFSHVSQYSHDRPDAAKKPVVNTAYGLTRNKCTPARFVLQDTANVGA
jgi:hypothetical protein